jgi:hypothetical protein
VGTIAFHATHTSGPLLNSATQTAVRGTHSQQLTLLRSESLSDVRPLASTTHLRNYAFVDNLTWRVHLPNNEYDWAACLFVGWLVVCLFGLLVGDGGMAFARQQTQSS